VRRQPFCPRALLHTARLSFFRKESQSWPPGRNRKGWTFRRRGENDSRYTVLILPVITGRSGALRGVDHTVHTGRRVHVATRTRPPAPPTGRAAHVVSPYLPPTLPVTDPTTHPPTRAHNIPRTPRRVTHIRLPKNESDSAGRCTTHDQFRSSHYAERSGTATKLLVVPVADVCCLHVPPLSPHDRKYAVAVTLSAELTYYLPRCRRWEAALSGTPAQMLMPRCCNTSVSQATRPAGKK
jgi:hypothetical protein